MVFRRYPGRPDADEGGSSGNTIQEGTAFLQEEEGLVEEEEEEEEERERDAEDERPIVVTGCVFLPNANSHANICFRRRCDAAVHVRHNDCETGAHGAAWEVGPTGAHGAAWEVGMILSQGSVTK